MIPGKTAREPSAQAAAQRASASDWWRGAVIYQIYPRSFHDASGDGVGDLRGITAKLGHVARLGVDAIWISPFFPSPMKDFGYDLSAHCAVDPLFGTLEDFEDLLARAHQMGIRVMIDQVLSHTSDEHPWFIESRAARHGPRADWYVWADPQPDGTPPNNWLSVFGGSAWQWDTGRSQYYLHNFLACQPDLNFHCAEVRAAILATVRFWLDRGVDGYRLDTANFFFHDAQLRSNPPRDRQSGPQRDMSVGDFNPYMCQMHLFDKSRPENLAFLGELRALSDRYPGSVLLGEIGDDDGLARMAEYTAGKQRLHMAYSFDLLGPAHSASFLHRTFDRFNRIVTDGWPAWAIGNHDVVRVATRWAGSEASEAMRHRKLGLAAAMQLSLRGTPCIYQGEELGLDEAELRREELQDPYGIAMWPRFKGRDGCRTPMPWEAQPADAGFGCAPRTPWLPIPPQHRARAVDQQEQQADSLLNHYRALLAWRRATPVIREGTMRMLPLGASDDPGTGTLGSGASTATTGEVPAAPDTGEVPAASDTGEAPAAPDTGEVPAASDTGPVLGFLRALGDNCVLCLFNWSDRNQTLDLSTYPLSDQDIAETALSLEHAWTVLPSPMQGLRLTGSLVHLEPWGCGCLLPSAGDSTPSLRGGTAQP